MKTPKLYLKGVKEPKELRYAEGKRAEEMISDVMISPETPFVVQGVVSCYKRDMKFVDWVEEMNYESTRIEFGSVQAQEFEQQISDFLIESDLPMEKEMDLLFSKGFINMLKKNPDGENTTITDFKIAVVQENLSSYISFLRKLDAWKDYRAKKEFVERQKLRGFEETARKL